MLTTPAKAAPEAKQACSSRGVVKASKPDGVAAEDEACSNRGTCSGDQQPTLPGSRSNPAESSRQRNAIFQTIDTVYVPRWYTLCFFWSRIILYSLRFHRTSSGLRHNGRCDIQNNKPCDGTEMLRMSVISSAWHLSGPWWPMYCLLDSLYCSAVLLTAAAPDMLSKIAITCTLTTKSPLCLC